MKKLDDAGLALERARQAYSEAYRIFREAARDLNDSPVFYYPGQPGWRAFLACARECERCWDAWQTMAARATRPAKSIAGCM